jgi:superfamily II DNA or RNA helicase
MAGYGGSVEHERNGGKVIARRRADHPGGMRGAVSGPSGGALGIIECAAAQSITPPLFSTRFNTVALAQRDTHGLSVGAQKVALASALLWTFRTRTDIYNLLGQMGLKGEDGQGITAAMFKSAVQEIKDQGLLIEGPPHAGTFQLADSLRAPLYRRLLESAAKNELADLVAAFDRIDTSRMGYYWSGASQASTVAFVRAKLFSGAAPEEVNRIHDAVGRMLDWNEIITQAALLGFDGPTFERICAQWRWQFAYQAVASVCLYWSEAFLPVADWSIGQLAARKREVPEALRLVLADLALQRGDAALARAALQGLNNGMSAAIHAGMLIIDGQWAAGKTAFEAAIKQRQIDVGARKRIFPLSVAWLYPLALLAQSTPKHLETARKFCIAEAGTRNPDPDDAWGRWVHAINVRLGDARIDPAAFVLKPGSYGRYGYDDLWRILLAAWMGADAVGIKAAGAKALPEWRQMIHSVRERLQACKFDVLKRMVDCAEAVLDGREPPSVFFVAGPGEQWRDVLTALQALGAGDITPEAGVEKTRVVWEIRLGKQGSLEAIAPLEQKRGLRGWSKPKALSLSKIARNERLPPWDAKVARALRGDRRYARHFTLDRAAAIVALVGHPAVTMASAPDQMIDLVEGTPELEVVRQGERFVMRIEPPLRPETDAENRYYMDGDERREAEALRLISLVQDSAQRVRLVRFTAAQRRAAQLVSGRFAVPANAHAEMDKALRALAGHFQVHADAAQAATQVASDSRLRAELAPVGEHLSLRLVVAPLGIGGPRLAPATGRMRLMAAIGGDTVGTERDLEAERAHLDSVLDALPFLDSGEDGSEWIIEDPEQALGLVEILPTLTAIAAVDWPKGKSVRVLTLDVRQVGIKVSREHDWFRVSGQATLDEGLVLQLGSLLAATGGKSRFVPMGDGVYAALTRSLRQKLTDLAAVVESDREGARVPALAAAWLDEILDGTELDASANFRKAIDSLRAAQAIQPTVPKSLQTELRPYQEDGYQWAIRLAAAGLGGILADDMGLGKTLQALGVMLERAAGGAALVLAPTSVCGNWLAETLRFAPSLNVRIYGEGGESEREQQITGAGPQDVLIVSYTLLQLAQERFAARTWHTLVADEAQAIKNSAAKRSQAVFDLQADFRLALSGTPIENRLAELWSIMRFVNPGLLGTLNRFNERFAGPIERNRDRDAQHVLKRLIAPFVLRRTKAEVLQELPPRTELVLSVTPEAPEAAHYEALRRQAVSAATNTLNSVPVAQARFNILAQLMRLRRAACDPRLANPEFGITGAKVQAFAELATELTANGHKTLVFSQFVDFLNLLRAPLDTAGIRYQYLVGSTPAAERSRRIAAFQAGEGELFLISLKAGGFGLNLTAADYVVITDPWWNPAAEDQAMGRAHRIGQLRPVTVYRLVTKGTVEERIVDLHHDKRALADGILSDSDTAALPSTEDLVALIRGR